MTALGSGGGEEVRTPVTVTADTVRRRDVLQVGGLPLTVRDLISLAGGAKRLLFTTGETLTIHRQTVLTATRAAPPPRRIPRHSAALDAAARRLNGLR